MNNISKSNNIQFSVIVPVYNGQDTIQRCLDSILNQQFDDFELIVVDDGSVDNTATIVKKQCNAFKNFNYYYKNNGGLTSARNFGLTKAKGEYIVYVDSDDYVDKEYLKRCNEILQNNKNLDIIVFNYYEYINSEKINKAHLHNLNGKYNDKDLEDVFINTPDKFSILAMTAWCCCIRRHHLLKHYCKDETITWLEDFCHIPECVMHAKNLYFDKDSFYYYDLSIDSSMTKNANYNTAFCAKPSVYVITNGLNSQVFRLVFSSYFYNRIIQYLYNDTRKMLYKNKKLSYKIWTTELHRLCEQQNISYEEFVIYLQKIGKFCNSAKTKKMKLWYPLLWKNRHMRLLYCLIKFNIYLRPNFWFR